MTCIGSPELPDPSAPAYQPARHVLTVGGIRIGVFYTKSYNRLLVSLTAADQPPGPAGPLRRAGGHHQPFDDYASRAPSPSRMKLAQRS